jgi:SAM-dependent methyltransferase
LIKKTAEGLADDEAIYRHIQKELPTIKPFLAELTYALPSLFKQKKEMARQTLQLLDDKKHINGYLEIGSTGRYISELQKHIKVMGSIVLVNEAAPSYSPVDIAERGGLRKLGDFYALNNYESLSTAIADASLDVVTCYVGLHHAPLDRLEAFIASIARVLRAGGVFILRDHDVTTPQMHSFVSLVHTVFNAGLNEPWEVNEQELRHFRPIAEWVSILASHGLIDGGQRILQANDPSDNVLLAFTKIIKTA